tara:strand:+ start:16707 stop:17213 length:507 start_codon:yes stop_codon:yes gene_type:complete
MKIDKKLMLKLMKEEYDKRVEYFLREIEVKDKNRDVNLIEDAVGLKVRNKQGLELTVEDFVVIDNVEYVVLRPPEMSRAGLEDAEGSDLNPDRLSKERALGDYNSSMSEGDDDEPHGLYRDIKSKSTKMDYKRTFKDYDASIDSLKDSDIRDGLVYVKITDFESEYSL